MTVIADWPSDLPHVPVFGGWTGGPQTNAASFQPETGPAIERPRATATPHIFEAVFPRFTTAQTVVFDDFVLRVLKQGTLPFLWRDPRSGDIARWRIVRADPLYSWRQTAAGIWSLSLKLMRLPGNPTP